MDGMFAFLGNNNNLSSALDADFYNRYDNFLTDDNSNGKEAEYSVDGNESFGSPSVMIFITNERELL